MKVHLLQENKGSRISKLEGYTSTTGQQQQGSKNPKRVLMERQPAAAGGSKQRRAGCPGPVPVLGAILSTATAHAAPPERA